MKGKMKTINISEETYEELKKRKNKLLWEHSLDYSYDGIIKSLLEGSKIFDD